MTSTGRDNMESDLVFRRREIAAVNEGPKEKRKRKTSPDYQIHAPAWPTSILLTWILS